MKFVSCCLFIVIMLLLVMGGSFLAYHYSLIKKSLPSIESLKHFKMAQPLSIYTNDGIVIGEFGHEKRFPLEAHQIPELVKQAIIAAEDARFHSHKGVDWIAVIRAMKSYLKYGKPLQGASTITQQLARNMFLSREKTLSRKIKEALISLKIEKHLDKDSIITIYLNKIYFGKGAYGIEAASQVYFNKPIANLKLSEIAMLAGLPKAPSVYNPFNSYAKALSRRNWVLSRMYSLKMVDEETYKEALSSPIDIYKDRKIKSIAPYVAEMVRKELVKILGAKAYTKGYKVYTTIDSKMQENANNAVIDNIFRYDKRHGYKKPKRLWSSDSQMWNIDKIGKYLRSLKKIAGLYPGVVTYVDKDKATVWTLKGSVNLTINQINWARSYIDDYTQGPSPKKVSEVLNLGDQIWLRKEKENLMLAQIPEVQSSMVVLDGKDGAIKALVGGLDFKKSKFNRAIQAKRQVGSTIKPFIYAAALDNGFTLSSIVVDSPITIEDALNNTWSPKNYSNKYHGPIRLRKALGLSKNTVAVKLMLEIGLEKTINFIQNFFPNNTIPVLESIALGSVSLSALDLARAYSPFVNEGNLVQPYFVDKIYDSNGNVVYSSNKGKDINVISNDISFLMRDALRSSIFGESDWQSPGFKRLPASLKKRRDIGGKTGTSSEVKDAWFCGFGGHIISAIWVGFDDGNRSLGYTSSTSKNKLYIYGQESGSKTAQVAWNEFMERFLLDKPEVNWPMSENILVANIDPKTGLIGNYSKNPIKEYFIKGTEKRAPLTLSYQDEEEYEEDYLDMWDWLY